jgi:hypothetical protein
VYVDTPVLKEKKEKNINEKFVFIKMDGIIKYNIEKEMICLEKNSYYFNNFIL